MQEQQSDPETNWRKLPKDFLFAMATSMLETAEQLPKQDPKVAQKLQAAMAILDFLSEQETEFSSLSQAPIFEMLSMQPEPSSAL